MEISIGEFERFRGAISNRCGIFIRDDKKYLVENRADKLLGKYGIKTFGEFCNRLESYHPVNDMIRDTLDAVSTGETLWFRDRKPFQALETCVFPSYLKEIEAGKRRRVAIWSAACSTGQEPYSISITAHDYFYHRLGYQPVNVMATDLSWKAVEKAVAGEYDRISMERGMPDAYRESCFIQNDSGWSIRDIFRKPVTFKQFNLKDSFETLAGPFDIIFLRNVIIYFSSDFKKKLFHRIAEQLSDRGWLFIGSSEAAEPYSGSFERVSDMGGGVYRLNQNIR